MKELLVLMFGFAGAMLAGCSTTTITETTYAADGKTVASVKVTETRGNPFVILGQNSRDKIGGAHRGGGGYNIGYSDWGINGGSLDNTVASFTDEENAIEIAKFAPAIVDASKYSLSVSTDGIKAENAEEKSNAADSAENAQAETAGE